MSGLVGLTGVLLVVLNSRLLLSLGPFPTSRNPKPQKLRGLAGTADFKFLPNRTQASPMPRHSANPMGQMP